MLGYISQMMPECLKAFPSGMYQRREVGASTVWYPITETPIQLPPLEHAITLDNGDKVLRLSEGLDPNNMLRWKRDPNDKQKIFIQPIGKLVELGEVYWHMPKLVVFPEGTELKRRLQLVSNNGEPYQVAKEHLKAFNRVDLMWEYMRGAAGLTRWQRAEIIADCLSVNYFITPHEVAVYGLIDEDFSEVEAFFDYCLDWKLFVDMARKDLEEAAKKKLEQPSA
jgi:hypothetical protein